MRDHRLIDERSLALATAIAQRVERDPTLIDVARENIARWKHTCSPGVDRTLDEWLDILNGPLEGVVRQLKALDERAVRLRQSNPFAGVLPHSVRNQIFLEFEARDAATT